MRNSIVSMLFIAFALFSGACAGRQVRTSSIPAPPRAEAVEIAVVPTLAVEAPAADQAPDLAPAIAAEQAEAPAVEPALTVEIAENDAAQRAAAIEPVAAAPRPAKRHRRAAAPAVAENGGCEAAAGLLAAAPTPASTQAPAAPAAPSILPASAPQGALTDATAGPTKDPTARSLDGTPLAPDRAAVAASQAYLTTYLYGLAVAVTAGLIIALILTWLRNRRLDAIASDPYADHPDGYRVEEVACGRVVRRFVIKTSPSAQRVEPDAAERQVKMDEIEKTWHAAGEAMEEVPPPELPIHDRFDHSDAEIAVHPPSQPPAPPAPDATPRPAPAPARIISSSDDVRAVSGDTVINEPSRDAQAPATYPSVIYEPTALPSQSETEALPISAAASN